MHGGGKGAFVGGGKNGIGTCGLGAGYRGVAGGGIVGRGTCGVVGGCRGVAGGGADMRSIGSESTALLSKFV